jgi:hypothetical protein
MRLSPREHTIAGINQNYISHAGEFQTPALTHLGCSQANNKNSTPSDDIDGY